MEHLFISGAIQVLVVSQSLAWGLNSKAHLTVVMDTQYFDGRSHRYVDYRVTDVIQMIGLANQIEDKPEDSSCKDALLTLYDLLPTFCDVLGVSVLMCLNSRKEFYKKFLYEPLPVEVRMFQFQGS